MHELIHEIPDGVAVTFILLDGRKIIGKMLPRFIRGPFVKVQSGHSRRVTVLPFSAINYVYYDGGE